MNKNNNFNNTTEENFLKNKAKRKHSASSNHKRNSVNTRRALKIAGIVLASIAGVILAVALGILIYSISLGEKVDFKKGLSGDENSDKRATAGESDNINPEDSIDIGNFKYYTFLATATDVSGNLTDVIMVARFHYEDTSLLDEDGNRLPKVSVLQIPRDTYVKISSKLHLNEDGTLSAKNFDPKSGTYATKINGVFAHGRSLARSTVNQLLEEVEGKSDKEVESICNKSDYKFLNLDVSKVKKYSKSTNKDEKKELKENIIRDFGITYLSTLIYHYFGIPIDYQAQVNVAGFRGIVDAIGGVDLDVPRRMYYKDPYQDLYIDLYPGYQHLDGKKAEQFVRFRSYALGDIARLDAQKLFINAFLDKLLSPSTVTKIDDIIVEIQENLYTGISFNDLLRFSKKVLKMDISSDIALHTLPGIGEYVGNVSYFIAYRQEALELINRELNVYDEALEEADLKVIDYNDLLSGSKPAATTSNTLTAPSSSETKKEETTSESNKPSDENNTISESTSSETTDNTDSEEDSTGNSEHSSDTEVPDETVNPDSPYYETPVVETTPPYNPDSEENNETTEEPEQSPEVQDPVIEDTPAEVPEETTPDINEPETTVPDVVIPEEAVPEPEAPSETVVEPNIPILG